MKNFLMMLFIKNFKMKNFLILGSSLLESPGGKTKNPRAVNRSGVDYTNRILLFFEAIL